MQNIIFYVAANEPLGTVRDYVNAKTVAAPTLILGSGCTLKMRLFANASDPDAYPLADLSSVTSWIWQMDADFTTSTTRKIEADTNGISVASVTATINGESRTYTEVTINISNMLSTELSTYMSGAESKTINGELVGYDSNSKIVFLVQVMGFTVRGRISDPGSPTELPAQYLTATQINTLLTAMETRLNTKIDDVPDFQFSVDGSTNWHETRASDDEYYRTSHNGTSWGPAIPMGRFGVVVDNLNFAFSTTEGQAATVSFTKTQLGITSDREPVITLWIKQYMTLYSNLTQGSENAQLQLAVGNCTTAALPSTGSVVLTNSDGNSSTCFYSSWTVSQGVVTLSNGGTMFYPGYDFSSGDKTNIYSNVLINTASYIAKWTNDTLEITYYTTWPAGDWIIKLS